MSSDRRHCRDDPDFIVRKSGRYGEVCLLFCFCFCCIVMFVGYVCL